MVAENSPVYVEITLLETVVDAGVLGPKRKWQAVIKKLDKYVDDLEKENKKLKDPHIKLDHFVPDLAKLEEPHKWGDDKLDGQREKQRKLREEGEGADRMDE